MGPILDAIRGEGIDAGYLAGKLKEELEATEVRVFNGQGGIAYSDPLIAWKIRQEARKDAHKLLDQYPTERKEVTHKGRLDHVHHMTDEELNDAITELEEIEADE